MIRPGATNSLVDVPGVEVGQHSDLEGLTGVTTVLVREGATGGVMVGGAAPGTRETDLLDPGNLVEKVQAVVLAGGSAFGLDAAAGVMRYLEEQGLGQPVGDGRVVPIVPAAVLFDFDVGDYRARPDAAAGYSAAAAASARPFEQGTVGAGTGARAGGLKGGLGSASAVLDEGVTVAAAVAVNSLGRVHDPVTGELFGAALALPGEFEEHRAVQGAAAGVDRADPDYSALLPEDASLAGRNTTIGLVATNAKLSKAQSRKLAQMAHDGLARAIRPAHTMFDGDTIFALATGEKELAGPVQFARLGAIAADCFARAIVHGMLAARSAGGLQSYRDSYMTD